MTVDDLPKNEYGAQVLEMVCQDEERNLERFAVSVQQDIVDAFNWEPRVEDMTDRATKVRVYRTYIAALRHTPDPEAPVPADEETPEERVARLTEYSLGAAIRKASCLPAGRQEQIEITTLIHIHEILRDLS